MPSKKIPVRGHDRRKPHGSERVHVDAYTRQQELSRGPSRGSVELGPRSELLHPLWPPGTEPLKAGDSLFRGTSSKFVGENELRSHDGRRIYFSEGDEDAEGYADITVDEVGGKPLLVEVELTPELASRLEPGLEGAGEWYIEADSLSIPIEKRPARRMEVF